MQLNSTAHHSSPQSDDAQPMSPVAPIGSLGLLLHGSAGCQKFDGFTLRVTDRRFVQLPSFIFFYSLPPRSFPKVFCWLWRIGMPLAIWETTRVIFMRKRFLSTVTVFFVERTVRTEFIFYLIHCERNVHDTFTQSKAIQYCIQSKGKFCWL